MLSSLMVLACGLLAFNIAGTYAADATIEDEIAKHLPPNETVPTISVQGIPWAMRSHELIPDGNVPLPPNTTVRKVLT